MWFATWNGLVRFDGNTFYTFKPIPDSDGVIQTNRIYNIKKNTAGNMWCVSSDGKLYLFDTSKFMFQDVFGNIGRYIGKRVRDVKPMPNGATWITFMDNSCVRLEDNDYLSNPRYYDSHSAKLRRYSKIFAIQMDSMRHEWIITDSYAMDMATGMVVEGGYRYLKSSGSCVCLVSQSGNLAVVDGGKVRYSKLPNGMPAINYVLFHNGLLLLATDGGVYRYDLQSCQASRLSATRSLFAYVDSKDRLWSFGGTNSVVLVPLRGGSPVSLATRPSPPLQLPPMKNPQMVFEHPENGIIIKPERGMLSYFDEATQSLLPCAFYRGNSEISYSPGDLGKFIVDKQFNLWVFQTNRVDCISFHPNIFSCRPSPRLAEVRAVLGCADGSLWLSDRSNALYSLCDADGKYLYLSPSGRWQPSFCRFCKSPVYAMAHDGKGRIWVGTKGDGLYIVHPSVSGRCHIEHFGSAAGRKGSLPSDTVYDICRDSRGVMWICSYGGGLAHAETRGDGGIDFVKVDGLPADANVRGMLEARPGVMLLATTGGLVVADLRDKAAPVFYVNKFRKEPWGLKGNDVMRVVESGGRYYACVFGSGVSELVSDSLFSDELRFRNYAIPSVATADQIKTAIAVGGSIWIVSERAITRFSTDLKTFAVINENNFIGGANLSEALPAVWDNRVVIGTASGFMWFDKAGIYVNQVAQRVVFTGIRYQNSMEVMPLNDADRLEVSPDKRSFSLFFSTLDYAGKHEKQYRYMLDGYDKGWNYINGSTRSITYNNLAPGKYKLLVQTVTDGGAWGGSPRSMDVVVEARFVETALFRVIVALAVVSVMLSMLYASVHYKRMRNIIQKKYSLALAVDRFAQGYTTAGVGGEPVSAAVGDELFLKHSIEFFNDNICNGNITVEDFARSHGMSRTTYYNRIKEITGLAPVDFIRQLRIKQALKLLDGGTLSISDVAYKVGFSDPKYFSRCFRAEMGMSPSQYLQERRGNGKR